MKANSRAIYLVLLKCSSAGTSWLSLNYFFKLETNRKYQFSSFLKILEVLYFPSFCLWNDAFSYRNHSLLFLKVQSSSWCIKCAVCFLIKLCDWCVFENKQETWLRKLSPSSSHPRFFSPVQGVLWNQQRYLNCFQPSNFSLYIHFLHRGCYNFHSFILRTIGFSSWNYHLETVYHCKLTPGHFYLGVLQLHPWMCSYPCLTFYY